MCGKAKSTATQSKIESIINNAMSNYESENHTQEDTKDDTQYNTETVEETDNIVPGMLMYVAYYNKQNILIIEEMKWGLYGFAGKSNGITYNSRVENIKNNYMSKKIQSNRGIVIIDGFYEKMGKTSNYISNKQNCLVVPVLFEIPSYGLNVFTMLTKPADENILHIHKRQPVVLDDLNLCKWMNMIKYNKISIVNNISNMINICEQPLTFVDVNAKKIIKRKKIKYILIICEETETESNEIKAA